MASEEIPSIPIERWNYKTATDLAQRARMLADLVALQQRVDDMEAFIEYANTRLPQGYMVAVELDLAPGFDTGRGAMIYSLDSRGDLYERTPIEHQPAVFLGDKIMKNGDDVVVFNTAEQIGISTYGPIRFVDMLADKQHYESGAELPVTYTKKFEYFLTSLKQIEDDSDS